MLLANGAALLAVRPAWCEGRTNLVLGTCFHLLQNNMQLEKLILQILQHNFKNISSLFFWGSLCACTG